MKKLFILVVCIVLGGKASFAQTDSTGQMKAVPDFYEKVRLSVGDSNILRAYYTDTLGVLTLKDTRKQVYDRDTLFGVILGASYPQNVLKGSFFLIALDHENIFYLGDNMDYGFRSRFVCMSNKKLLYNNQWLREAIERTSQKDFAPPTQEELQKFVNRKFAVIR